MQKSQIKNTKKNEEIVHNYESKIKNSKINLYRKQKITIIK